MSQKPLYNSRIIRTYIEFIESYFPEIDINQVLNHSQMTHYEVQDGAHWFTQAQVDRFHEQIAEKTGKADIARDAGRFAASAKGLGAARQYTMGLMSLTSAYLLMGKLYPLMSRAADVTAKKLKANTVEIISTPKPGVDEKPYQCENRLGIFESLARFFTDRFAVIDHPSCFHRGDEACRYIITWRPSAVRIWKLVRNYSFPLTPAVFGLSFFFLSPVYGIIFTLVCLFLNISFSFYVERLEKKELIKTIKDQGNAAKDLLDETDIRYNNAIFIQEIGQASSKIPDIDKLLERVVNVMAYRLDFDRGMIMLANEDKTHLKYKNGYGYDGEFQQLAMNTGFHLDKSQSKGVVVRAFKEQKPFLVNDIEKIEQDLTQKSLHFLRQAGTHSFICAPIVYESESLGVILVDNVTSKRLLTQSDMNLLMGVASQTAVSLINASSFQKLQESAEKYKNILESIEEGYFEVDLAGNFTFFNDSVCRILGYTPEELMGMNNREYTKPEVASKIYKAFNQVYKTGKPVGVFDYEIRRKSGETLILELSVSLIRDAGGNPTGFRGVIRDCTERKKAEEMHREKLAAESASRAKSAFLASMSHEIRTPLNGIIGLSELAAATPLTEDQHEIITTITNEANSLLLIINDILDFSKIEGGMLHLEEIPFDLEKLMEESIRPLQLQAKQKGLRIISRLNPATPIRLVGDPVKLKQIFANLVGNAIKFTHEGEIRIEGEPETSKEGGEEKTVIRFSVTDTGIGISQDKLGTIFESFTQEDSSTTRKYGGTGLGTAISKQLVELMSGEIGVESEKGKGSTFWFTAVFGVQSETVTAQQTKEKAAKPAASASAGEEIRILLAEDYPTSQKVVIAFLKSEGYQVDLAENGLAALELYRRNIYDLILMDIEMPLMDGYEVTKEIRRTEAERSETVDQKDGGGTRVPIVAMTAHAVKGYMERCLEVGMDDYLTKPVRRDELLSLVREWTSTLNASQQTPPDVEERADTPPEPVISKPDTGNKPSLSKTPVPVPPMDFERALGEFEGDRELLIDVLKGFLKNVDGQIESIDRAIKHDDVEQIRVESHTIKGGAANLTAETLSRTAFELEKRARSKDMEGCKSQRQELEREFNLLKSYAKDLYASS